MAIISVKDVGTKGGWTPDGGRTYTAEVEVETDSRLVGSKAVVDSLNLFANMVYRFPLVEPFTESDTRCFLTSVDASRSAGDDRQWRVVLQFGPRTWDADEKGPVDENGNRDPFAAPPTLRARAEEEEVAVTIDRHGEPILNSAGDPFDPPISVTSPSLVFEVSRLERNFRPEVITALQGRVNDSTWLGFPAESVLCRSITADRKWNEDAGGWAWDTTYELAVRQPILSGSDEILPGWSVRVLDAGLRQLVGGVRKQIQVDHAPISSPVALKSDGTVAAPSDDPNYLSFDIYPEGDFSLLDFPSDLFTAGTPEPPPEDPEDP